MKTAVIVFVITWCCTAAMFPQPQSAAKKIILAQRINPRPPLIDGALDDEVWQHEEREWGSGFIQRTPDEGKAPSQPTAFKILYDEKNLYIAIRAYDSEPGKIEKRLARRDILEGDWVEVQIDSYFDHRTAFTFAVNAAGVKRDRLIANDGGSIDENWDPNWTVKTTTDQQGWCAEMKIPFNQLRFADRAEMTWGLYVGRQIHRFQEISDWSLIPNNAPGWVSLFGELHGLHNIAPKKEVELLPYTVGKMQFSQTEVDNPFSRSQAGNLIAGLDGKVAITNDLTLNLTVNPDFGQVEADPSQVNLTAFETYFQEKRPFFIEGNNILNFQIMGGDGSFSMDNLFYSRRIGRQPHHEPDLADDEYMEIPGNTSIYGAFKVTGKTGNGWSLGILESLTGKEIAHIDHQGERRQEAVEPLTNYFLLRAQKDYNKGLTILGGMLTAVNRRLSGTALDFLHQSAFCGGFDFYHCWKEKTYYFSLKTVFSNVNGSREAIRETQESAVHYFQRPDATHINFNVDRTSLFGHGGTLSFGKQGGGHLNFSTGATWRSPGLELNDMGYLRSADRVMQWVWAGYSIWKPFAIFKSMYFNFNQWEGIDFSGQHLFAGGNFSISCQFANYWEFSSGINVEGRSLSTAALRGGPALLFPGGWSHWLNIRTDSRRKLTFECGLSSYWGVSNSSRSREVWGGVTYRPIDAFSISLFPTYSYGQDQLQYVDTIDSNDLSRYVCATIEQDTFYLTIRLNFSLTPDLSLQFYGQPFLSSGKYFQFKRITNPRAAEFSGRFHVYDGDEIACDPVNNVYAVAENGGLSYRFDNPEFKLLEFRSNLVLRWEYRPGATLFLVWSQGRSNDYSDSEFSLRRDFNRLFHLFPDNIFLVKFSYRFDL